MSHSQYDVPLRLGERPVVPARAEAAGLDHEDGASEAAPGEGLLVGRGQQPQPGLPPAVVGHHPPPHPPPAHLACHPPLAGKIDDVLLLSEGSTAHHGGPLRPGHAASSDLLILRLEGVRTVGGVEELREGPGDLDCRHPGLVTVRGQPGHSGHVGELGALRPAVACIPARPHCGYSH